jgi:predicted kinase
VLKHPLFLYILYVVKIILIQYICVKDIILSSNLLNIKVTRPNQELILMRGVSGSGKSTKAKQLVGNGVIHSTDQVIEDTTDSYSAFFEYIKDHNAFHLLGEKHKINLENAKKSMFNSVTPVVIDNTNLRPSECKPYIEAALRLGLHEDNIHIVDVSYGNLTAKDLASRNQHGVPEEHIEKMMQRYNSNKNLNVKTVMSEGKSNILYSSVVLDSKSRELLLSKVSKYLPVTWDEIAHHMTICFGEGLPGELKSDLGLSVSLEAYEIGISDMACAVKVRGYYSKNKIPHITIGVNTREGGKPVMSNDITSWQQLSEPIRLTGVVSEHRR